MSGGRLIDRFRRPEYTGENRCLPCTVTNVLLTVLGSAFVAALSSSLWGTPAAVLSGGVFLAVGSSSVYLRGYLVPGTPTLTARYFPEWLLRLFGKADVPDPGTRDSLEGFVADLVGDSEATGLVPADDGDGNGVGDSVTAVLRGATVVEPGDSPRLVDDFETDWRREAATVRESGTLDGPVADLVGTDESVDLAPENVFSDTLVARVGANGRKVGQWESRAAVVADIAAARVMRSRFRRWDDLSVRERGAVLYTIRALLEACPACEGSLGDWAAIDREAVPSCCAGTDAVARECVDCDARVVEREAGTAQ